jgi:hypothetical protein
MSICWICRPWATSATPWPEQPAAHSRSILPTHRGLSRPEQPIPDRFGPSVQAVNGTGLVAPVL